MQAVLRQTLLSGTSTVCKGSPAWRLTPAASYMTIKLNARLTANNELPRPNSSAVAVVTACNQFPCQQRVLATRQRAICG